MLKKTDKSQPSATKTTEDGMNNMKCDKTSNDTSLHELMNYANLCWVLLDSTSPGPRGHENWEKHGGHVCVV